VTYKLYKLYYIPYIVKGFLRYIDIYLKDYSPYLDSSLFIVNISDLVNRDISTAKGSRKPIRLDCL
jgi:hypothetical protein